MSDIDEALAALKLRISYVGVDVVDDLRVRRTTSTRHQQQHPWTAAAAAAGVTNGREELTQWKRRVNLTEEES